VNLVIENAEAFTSSELESLAWNIVSSPYYMDARTLQEIVVKNPRWIQALRPNLMKLLLLLGNRNSEDSNEQFRILFLSVCL